MASSAWGQQPPPRGAGGEPSGTTTAPAPSPPSLPPPSIPIAAYPLELLGLLAPGAQRGPVTLTPSIAVSEEYNDNIFLNNQNRQSDFITSFSPALTLYVNRASYALSAGYSFSADLYARESRFNEAFDRQNFVATGLYRLASGLTLTASDGFALNRNSNLVAAQGFSSGRQESWGNNFSPGMNWQMTPSNSLGLSASYSVLRFVGSGAGVDSDTYSFGSNLTHIFTPRFSGILNYGFTYLKPQREQDSTTHTPMVGFSYVLTPTLTATITGGAAITELGGDTFVGPAATASLVQVFSFGSASLQYSQGVSVAGGFGGTTNTKTVSSTLTLSTLLRGLFVVLSPSYSVSESVGSGQTQQVDVKAITLSLGATYQIAQYASLFGGYTFFRQRTGGSSPIQNDVDQNRVRFGLQFGYPFNFD
jgi:hypothetical protein